MVKLSKPAALSLAFGVLSFLIFPLAPIAMIAGAAALYKIRRSSGALKGAPLAICGIIAGSAALLFAGSVMMSYRAFRVPTASMSPTIKAKDRIVADLRAYKAKSPERWEIVVYELLDKGKRRVMCKRVVGLPGEDIEIRSGKIYVNGMPEENLSLPKGISYLNSGDFGRAGQSVKIPIGAYYVLGDNPMGSFDSRQHGAVDRRDIKGRYMFAYRWGPA